MAVKQISQGLLLLCRGSLAGATSRNRRNIPSQHWRDQWLVYRLCATDSVCKTSAHKQVPIYLWPVLLAWGSLGVYLWISLFTRGLRTPARLCSSWKEATGIGETAAARQLQVHAEKPVKCGRRGLRPRELFRDDSLAGEGCKEESQCFVSFVASTSASPNICVFIWIELAHARLAEPHLILNSSKGL